MDKYMGLFHLDEIHVVYLQFVQTLFEGFLRFLYGKIEGFLCARIVPSNLIYAC